MLSKQSIKLDWLKTWKQNTQVMHTQKQEERKRKVIESLGALFLPCHGRTFPLSEPLNLQWGGRIETVQVRKEHEGFE